MVRAGINHNFFPLTGGHEISDCKTCHTSGSYSSIDAACVSCHQQDYNTAASPNHITLQFSTDCKQCHNLNPGWSPAEYKDHDSQSFPIYSGTHKGEWDNCSDCHTNPSNYAQFTCTNCHEHNQGDTDDEHEGVSGYTYNSIACFGCHPNGSGDGAFDHNSTSFPLTGAHTTTNCSSCHTSSMLGHQPPAPVVIPMPIIKQPIQIILHPALEMIVEPALQLFLIGNQHLS
ncbi:MAG: hypothetical protein IPH84_07925 [Bacteroidales bacterium]|nr:hypothetical protein [Bacteroidales bacterium]